MKNCFPNLRVSIEAANEEYLEQLKLKAQKNEKKKRRQEEERLAERRAIKEALEGLDFS